MYMQKLFILSFGILMLSFAGCKQKNKPTAKAAPISDEQMMSVNEQLLRYEIEWMEQYAERHQWQVKKTPSGIFYEIYHQTNGSPIKNGETVVLNYELKLINGETIYSSKADGPKKFTLGNGEVETGLEEIVSFMHKGEKAHLLIPSHLGYGVAGDMNRIPQKAVLVYDIEVINTTKN